MAINKRGQGHIEVIISFALFAGFVTFILLFLRPSTKSVEIGLNSVENAVKSRIETNVSYFSVKIDRNNRNCFCFDSEYDVPEGIVVFNQDKEKVNSGKKNGEICIESNEGFFYVYVSDEFANQGGIACQNQAIPEFGQLRNIKAVSYNKIENFKEDYERNYNELKNSLGIAYYDFSVKFIDSIGQEIAGMEKSAPLGMPVYSRDNPVQIVYSDGNIKYGVMRVFVW